MTAYRPLAAPATLAHPRWLCHGCGREHSIEVTGDDLPYVDRVEAEVAAIAARREAT